jgi:hypothetical protein
MLLFIGEVVFKELCLSSSTGFVSNDPGWGLSFLRGIEIGLSPPPVFGGHTVSIQVEKKAKTC